MIHLGDITKISGYDVPPVDVVIGGSPCQDLSVAGKRAGLAGERSGLFMEQIRIIKEMREEDVRGGRTGKFIRPRFMVWENVPGAFSSNKGDDFRAVLEETIRVADPDAPDVPLPAKGKWPLADCWMGDGWSVAYRVLDAQFWGVPQRRRRIVLVADFGGHAAPEILFIRESVCGNIAEGGAQGEEDAAGAGSGAGQASAYRIGAYYSAGMLSDNPKAGIIPVEKSNTLDCNGGAPTSQQGGVCIVQPAVYDARGNGDGKTACTLTGDHQSRVTDYTAIAITGGPGLHGEIAGTLDASYFKGPGMRGGIEREIALMESGQVRRLTPLECERLQGYPDGWTDIGPWTDSAGKLHKESSDSARYKALGNSIALPPWAWVLKRLCACYERTATMASLFDGIGGFPLIWERMNGPGSCLWASEIEEFPIAVTRRRFGGEKEAGK